ncbi:MAG: hypothetical protein EOP84_26360 [Verrucomicrobiaceae bacterium]|nr:MAG: hypothetical protein EOP84_26360 [Verrucomicrobiaceae bacterium]
MGFVVLSQTCDCLNPDFSKEPHLELLPLEKIVGQPDSSLRNGRNPRQIQFQIQESGQEIWVNARITDICRVDRRYQEGLALSQDCSLTRATLDDLIHWRAQRYVRTAFPDSFETAFLSVSKKFGKLVSRHEKHIDSLLISLSPFEEIGEGECYEMQLRLMVTPLVMGQPTVVGQLKEMAAKIEELFGESSRFESPRCSVSGLDEMTLWEARNFLDFTRYDYLSFGQDEPPPGDPDS